MLPVKDSEIEAIMTAERDALLNKFREWAANVALSNAHDTCEVAEQIARQIRTQPFE